MPAATIMTGGTISPGHIIIAPSPKVGHLQAIVISREGAQGGVANSDGLYLFDHADKTPRLSAQRTGSGFLKGPMKMSGGLVHRLAAVWLADRCGTHLAIGGETSTMVWPRASVRRISAAVSASSATNMQ